ncbi:hypothetical protein EPUL_002430 [Erysiphe pulchra]|uniref:DUF1264-domain-containing protein n=1 Tax=Erysiphe pulchra TaxID=225359 RepID=A0A2S4PUQ7_9PEZI|nr:hypothetical protein EPUL_002430 [Erysiphe pulchra]
MTNEILDKVSQLPHTAEDKILQCGTASSQSFKPINSICAHLNAFHVYASDVSRSIEANHYCTQVSTDLRQCLIYDSPEKSARLIGVEYMINKDLYETLDKEERKLWHSHNYEVKSGMLIIHNSNLPNIVWEVAETEEMKELIGLYGKTFHFWQVDRGDKLPLGQPQLMMSFTRDEQVPWDVIKNRDERFGIETTRKKDIRKEIKDIEIHEDADCCWK